MNRKIFCLVSVFVLSAMLVLNLGYVQAQTPGRIAMFDPAATLGACSNAGIDCVDSVIFQDPATGNVGIGTTNPITPLQLNKDGDYAQALFETFQGTQPNVSSVLTLLRARGTATSPSAVLSGDLLGLMEFGG